MINNFGKTVGIIMAMLFLSGCNFTNSKKTEINLEKNETENVEETQDNVENIQNDEKKVEISSETEEDVAVAPNTEIVEKPKEEIVKNIDEPKIINKLADWGFSVSGTRKIDTIIIHSSYNAVGKDVHDLDDIIYKEYKPYGVSPHYIISRDGKIYRLVEDKNIAYHAGESKVPDGRAGVNNFSIGIEIVNTKSEKPNDAQYGALNNLLAYLKKEYKIKYVLGHDDIAPGRKDDPWNFDFEKIK
ncbi:MAG: N-acetylmuramoyl-L-alanine amidase [bacterium]|nr:N-acetylmuramoyl-L-alanine amidase [bacterium]